MSTPEVTQINPLDHLANLAWAAGDRLRLGVLRVLARDAFGVLELCQLSAFFGDPTLITHGERP